MGRLHYTEVWNFITGCTQISPACDYCYAMTMTKKLQATSKSELDKTINKLDYSKCTPKCKDITMSEEGDKLHIVCECKNTEHLIETPKYYYGWEQVVFHKSMLEEILNTNMYPSGSKVCVCNMSDLFHEDIDSQDLALVFEYMIKRKDLIFQVLTKRPERMLESVKNNIVNTDDTKHIWFGISAEDQAMFGKRMPSLVEVKKNLGEKVKIFAMIEPIMSGIDLQSYKDKLDWVVVGGENIPENPKKARSMQYEWVEDLYEQCRKYDIAFFFKQWGSNPRNRPDLINLKSGFPKVEEVET